MVAPPPKAPKRPSGVSSGISPASGSTVRVILPPPSSKKRARVVFEDADEDADEDKDKKKPKKEKQEKLKRDKKAAPTRKFLILFPPFEKLIICPLFRPIPHLSHPPRSPIYAVLPSSNGYSRFTEGIRYAKGSTQLQGLHHWWDTIDDVSF
jgi:hypothetical protein